jgi:small-conductance mechanosensitive channel
LRDAIAQLGPGERRLIGTAVILLAVLLVRWIALAIVRGQTRDARVRYAWRKGITYTAGLLAIFLIGRVWFEGLGSLATFLGLIGAGLAVALKDPLANLAGWLFILWRRPFRVGDRIQIGDVAGDVIDTRLFQFTLLEIGNWVDADQSSGRLVHVPNGRVFTDATANYTMGFPFIWNEIPVVVTFESNWEAARTILQEIALRHSGDAATAAEDHMRTASRRYLIYYSTFQSAVYTDVLDNGVRLTIRYVCQARERRGTTQRIWEDVLRAFAGRDDIDFAYPTTRFYDNVREGKPDARAHRGS